MALINHKAICQHHYKADQRDEKKQTAGKPKSVPQVSCTSEQCSVVSQIHVEGPVGTLRGCTTAV